MSNKFPLDSKEQADLLMTYFKMGRKKRDDKILMEMREKKVIDSILVRGNQDPGGVQDDVIDLIIDNSRSRK